VSSQKLNIFFAYLRILTSCYQVHNCNYAAIYYVAAALIGQTGIKQNLDQIIGKAEKLLSLG
jgi:hypothetical protein